MAISFSWLAGCGQPEGNLEEEANPSFLRGRDLLVQGRDEQALDQFLEVLENTTNAPQTHLELGRLLLQVEGRKDPVQAIFHFRSFLRLRPKAGEADNVEQLIETAEKQFLANLPGKPYAEPLAAMQLRESNQSLEHQIESLKTRLARYEPDVVVSPPSEPDSAPTSAPNQEKLHESPILKPKQETYVVKAGDSLFGISLRMYGSPRCVNAIYEANHETMPNKNTLRLGQLLTMPNVPRP
ncbi:MAG: LysM peptidoglycan-binding domain-containing protein [Opitutales bacterium]